MQRSSERRGLQARALRRSLGGRVLFEGLNLEVEPGQTLVVQGPSGVGKTQLLRALAGLVPLDAGEVTWRGQRAAELGMPHWRVEVALVAQRPAVLPGTPRAFVHTLQGLRARRGRAIQDPVALAAGWGLAEADWDAPWAQLSGGQQQRAALAVIVSGNPGVLLLDEPTSALDEDARDAVEATLRGRTVVWVTHDAAQADRVGDQRLVLR